MSTTPNTTEFGAFNGVCIVSCSTLKGSDTKPIKTDKAGNTPMKLTVMSGKFPGDDVHKSVIINGTAANFAGFIDQRVFICTFTEEEYDEDYGRQFDWDVSMAVSAVELMTMLTTMAPAVKVVTSLHVAKGDAPTSSNGPAMDDDEDEEYDEEETEEEGEARVAAEAKLAKKKNSRS